MLCWYLKYVLHIVRNTFTVWELRARANGRPVIMCGGISVWHPSPCVYVRVSQLHSLPPLCQHQNLAHCRVRPSMEQGRLGRGMGLFSPSCISPEQSLCALLTGVPISYPPISLLCQEQNPAEHPADCSVQPWQASTRGAGGVPACLPGRVLCSGSTLQHLSPCTWRMSSLSSVSLGRGPLLPHLAYSSASCWLGYPSNG